jgi:hypothetical protein
MGGGRGGNFFTKMDEKDYIQIQNKVKDQYTDARGQYLIIKK